MVISRMKAVGLAANLLELLWLQHLLRASAIQARREPMTFSTRILLLGSVLFSGCTTFGAVHSAEVMAGPALDLRVTVASPPGDDAGWFWSFDCASQCDRVIWSPEVSFTYGWVPAEDCYPYELGLGVAGVLYPYVHGYLQVKRGPRPFGLGARLGVPVTGWHEHLVFMRHDIPLSSRTRILLTPTFFLHTGNSPNGQNPGTFAAFVQGLGLEHTTGNVSLTPALSAVIGWTERESYGRVAASSSTVFLVTGLGIRFHRARL
ncbi:MAG: hypothetical protein ACRELD_01640 [Longimicrobiales bacterium]